MEVFDGAGWVSIGAPKMRAMLAVLLVRAPAVVPIDRLVFELWEDAPTKTAVTQIHGYVMRLRRTLGDAEGRLVVTAAPGYRLAIGDREVDVQEFTALTELGRRELEAGRAEVAAERLAAGLALWRGLALADVPPTPLLTMEVNRLTEQRLAAWEARVDADLACGRHARLIGELQRQVDEHPLREEPWRQLMLALYRSGRRVEALEAFQRLRRILVAEVGVEPSPAVRELHLALLADDLAAEDALAQPRRPVPRQLPAAPRFIGRADELKHLDELLDANSGPDPTMVISAIGGAAGMGKTALAVHWAQVVSDRFPDGQLYANLRGYDTGPPVSPAAVLAQFLRALGVAPDQVARDPDERAAQYRTLLADRRILVVLDNARGPDQVRPLLPGSSTCLTVITSRDDLRALTVTHGARRLRLDVLHSDDALALLTDVLGRERTLTDTGSLAELARLCGNLPLALRIAGANLASRPQQTIADHVIELRGGNLLGHLTAGADRQAAVRAAFDVSYTTLSEPAQRLFRLLGVAPVTDLTAHIAAALLDTTLADASAVLNQLAAAHMIEPTASNRFSCHDLVRAYARTLSEADPEPVLRDALTRLFDHYQHAAFAAMVQYAPYDRDRRLLAPDPHVSTVDFADRDSATAWLDAERENLLAVADHAMRHDWPTHTTGLSVALFRYLDVRADWEWALVLHGAAADAACRHNDLRAQVLTRHNLGITSRRLGRHPEALEHFQASRSLARRLGDPGGEARGLFDIAVIYRFLGHYSEVVDHLRQALELYQRIGDTAGQARVMHNLGSHYRWTGRYPEALDCLREGLTLARQAGNPHTESNLLIGIGKVYLMLGCHREAIEHFTEGLDLARAVSDPSIEAHALTNLGAVYRLQERYDQSLEHHHQALATALRIGDRNEEFESRYGIGAALYAAGHLDEALRQARTALALATELRVAHDQARAHDCIATIHAELGDTDHAREHWQQSHVIYTELDDPESKRVSQRLAALDSPGRQPSDP